jgi:hypothetical protein
MGNSSNSYEIIVGKPKWKSVLQARTREQENNIKINLLAVVCKDVNRNKLAPHRVKCGTVDSWLQQVHKFLSSPGAPSPFWVKHTAYSPVGTGLLFREFK